VSENAQVVLRQRSPVPSNMSLREIEIETEFVRRTKARRQGLFLKGPILMSRIGQANKLGGQSLALLLAIQHRCDVTRCSTVTLPSSLMAELGINRFARARGLRALEAAGIIRTKQERGKSVRLTLLT
jgi:hypothetical protein